MRRTKSLRTILRKKLGYQESKWTTESNATLLKRNKNKGDSELISKREELELAMTSAELTISNLRWQIQDIDKILRLRRDAEFLGLSSEGVENG